jgi:hypothetical protein
MSEPEIQRHCSGCKQMLPRSAFYPTTARSNYCIACARAYQDRRNRARILEREIQNHLRRKRRRTHPLPIRARHQRQLAKRQIVAPD